MLQRARVVGEGAGLWFVGLRSVQIASCWLGPLQHCTNRFVGPRCPPFPPTALAIYYSVNDALNTTEGAGPAALATGPVPLCDGSVSANAFQQAYNISRAASIACVPTAPDRHHAWVLLWFAVAWLLTTLSFQLACPIHYTPLGEAGGTGAGGVGW